MLNPSYSSLIKILNEDASADARVTSRYSIVIAAAKRARQIVGGAEYEDLGAKTDKAVSIAVNEIQRGFVRVVPGSVENITMPRSEHIIQNLPTVIDDSFVSDDIILNADEIMGDDDDDDIIQESEYDDAWDEEDEVDDEEE
ncbi:MAG: DNA-directed RNA polymerase subunit omega [Defluviitaleaceae bacterium]|nr:DNA-directed RNA polymerase subunit omega [Defluviitaleaceae bacterium]